ncbi:aspartic proteinase-like isoform X2 [Lotus japonicus]|uniref:aspartic proteinase-like isoform X2 n=1 Tax=Lotus japonicus TaxID=34305 RepID=UPI00258A366D|nr:aspartic proteinase-like isoform X2 [Lotus japonicus]
MVAAGWVTGFSWCIWVFPQFFRNGYHFFSLRFIFHIRYCGTYVTHDFTDVIEFNHAIGAQGIMSVEYKEIVAQYGELIWDHLVSGVCSQFSTPRKLHSHV